MLTLSLDNIADAVGGHRGCGAAVATTNFKEQNIAGLADLRSATAADISFCTSSRYSQQLKETQAAAVFLPVDAKTLAQVSPVPVIYVDNPYLAMVQIGQQLFPSVRSPAATHIDKGAFVAASAVLGKGVVVEAGAVIAEGAQIGDRVRVGALSYVGNNAIIGNDTLLHPSAKVLPRCVIGQRVILQAGAIIGSDGFGYHLQSDGKRIKIPHVGIVIVGDDVEIGANTTIDRAVFGATKIGDGCKIDNLVQIAHNVQLGDDCVLVSQSGVAGSAILGDRVTFAGQTACIGHVEIASDVQCGARTGITKSITQAGTYAGFPARDHKEWLKTTAAIAKLPEIRKRLRDLEQASS